MPFPNGTTAFFCVRIYLMCVQLRTRNSPSSCAQYGLGVAFKRTITVRRARWYLSTFVRTETNLYWRTVGFDFLWHFFDRLLHPLKVAWLDGQGAHWKKQHLEFHEQLRVVVDSVVEQVNFDNFTVPSIMSISLRLSHEVGFMPFSLHTARSCGKLMVSRSWFDYEANGSKKNIVRRVPFFSLLCQLHVPV